MHNSPPPSREPRSSDQVHSCSSPAHDSKRARLAGNDLPPSAPFQKSLAKATSSSRSQRSQDYSSSSKKSGREAAVNRQRAVYETPAALADPLGAFASKAGHKHRVLHSGLSLLKGKASQARFVSSNLMPPKEQHVASVNPQQHENKAAQQGTARRQQLHPDPRQQLPKSPQMKRCGADQLGQCLQASPKANACSLAKQHRPSANLQTVSPIPSMHSKSCGESKEQPQSRIDSHYLQNAKSFLHSLIQAHVAIPSFDTMSGTDKASLASLLFKKLEGSNTTVSMQQLFPPKAQTAHAETRSLLPKQRPSTASQIDATHSPESVGQHESFTCGSNVSTPSSPVQLTFHDAPLPTCFSNASHASAASSGSAPRRFMRRHMLHSNTPDPLDDSLDAFTSHANVTCHLPESSWTDQDLNFHVTPAAPAVLHEMDQDDLDFAADSPTIEWYASD